MLNPVSYLRMFLAVATVVLLAGAANAADGFAGSGTCTACHAAQAGAWEDSHHAWALVEPTPENILGDFDNATFTHGGVTTRLFRDGARYMVETDGPDGKPIAYEIRYAVGVTPLQQYLVETAGGRLQALDIAWDTERKSWFHLYPDQVAPAGNGLHWTGPYKNWQARCAECHQTGFDKAYDAASRTYKSTWAELTIGCESCHGPSATHAKAAREGRSVPTPAGKMGSGQQQAELAVCGPCHARRGAFSEESAPTGQRFSDHYSLSLLTPDLYFGDGQQREEVYILGSFLQSKMAAKGVTCSDCHEPHAATLKAEGNAICTQCHSPTGRDGFPTLARQNYDDPSHHRHPRDSAGAQCVSCHMPERVYMRIDGRRDHFFRIPDPASAKAAGAPDACTSCHTDKSQDWAATTIESWYPQPHTAWQDRAAVIAFNAGNRSPADVKALAGYLRDIERPALARATVARLLADGAPPLPQGEIGPLLADPDDNVRAAAVQLARNMDGASKLALLSPLLTDPSRLVRQAAAVELAGLDPGGIAADLKQPLASAIAEYIASRAAGADAPESQMALGGLALNRRLWPEAEAAFNEAVLLDPQLDQAWAILARLRAALGDEAGARDYLSRGLGAVPGSVALLFESASLEESRGDFARAIDWYRRIVGLEPANGQAWLAMAIAALQARNPALAVEAAAKVIAIQPDIPIGYVYAAIGHYLLGDRKQAQALARKAREIDPNVQLPPELAALL